MMSTLAFICLSFLVQNVDAFAVNGQTDVCHSNPCLNGGKCELHSGALASPVTSCKCPVEWSGDACENPTNVPAIRHDFGERSDMTVSGNLRQWPELGENGEAGIGRIKSNETFQLATNFLLETGKSACASFFYRREKTGSTLKFFYTTSGIRRPLWESVQDVSVNNTWKQVKIDLLGIQYLGNVVLTLEGNTTPSSGYLDIDDVLIVELACSLVNF